MSIPADLPVVITTEGLQPQSPASLNAQLIALVAANNPGYTILPGGLIEDISSTDTGALVLIDSFRVETVNSLTPFGANAFILLELGEMLGVEPGTSTNTSVYCVFTGPQGFVIGKGFTVTDGTYQYVAQDGGIIGAGNVSPQLFFVATIPGSWAIPPGTVNALVTSVPQEILDAGFSVANPNAGVPMSQEETEFAYRARVWQANLAASQGMSRYLKTLLSNIAGVVTRSIRALAQDGGGWLILCSGGDPYQVASGIFTALFDISTLVPSSINVTAVTNMNPGKVTTDIAHGLITGQDDVKVLGTVGITMPLAGGPYTVTKVDDFNFTIGEDTTSSGTWTSAGVVTPNARNVTASINDYPDTYNIPFVVPLTQTVTISLTWNTNSPNFVSEAAMAQLGAPALAAYVNGIAAGLPMNLFEMQAVFQEATASVLDPNLLTRMVFVVAIDGTVVAPTSGTGIIQGDIQSILSTTASAIAINQG